MEEYKSYDKYKDSGFEWIGKMPYDWQRSKIKYLIKEPVSDGPHETPNYANNGGVPFLSVDNIQSGKLVFDNCRKIPVKDHKIYKNKSNPEKGDILLGKAASVGKVAKVEVDFPFSIWSPLALIKPNNKVASSYLEYSMKSNYFQIQAELLSNANTQKNLGMKDISNMFVLKPSIKEQQKIAAFLDQKTAKIDKIINKKENLIEKLKEYKKSVITEAVTKGKLGDKYINEDGELVDKIEMKDSGIEWIEKIPYYWEKDKAKHISDVLLSNINKKTKEYEPKILLCNYTDVYYNDFIDSNIDFMKASTSYDKEKKLSLEIGDVIITKDSESPNDIGIPSCVKDTNKKLVCGYHLAILKPYRDIIKGEFLLRLLESSNINFQFNLKATGITRYSISLFTIKNILLFYPNLNVQKKIIEYLHSQSTEIDILIQKTKKSIEKYKEYKKSLIFEAVTGKMDLRDYEVEEGEDSVKHNNTGETERKSLSRVN